MHRREVEARLARLGAQVHEVEEETPYAFRVSFDYDGDLKLLADLVEDIPEAEVLSLGRSLEIVKDLGDAESVGGQYGLDEFTGTHAIGHVRMATESEVDIAGAHPYWAYPFSDVAVVHNGQLTNYFMWRRRLERAGQRFMSECDSEMIAVYLAERMARARRSRRRWTGRSTSSTASSRTSPSRRTSSASPRTSSPRSRSCSTSRTSSPRSPPRRSRSDSSSTTRSRHTTRSSARCWSGNGRADLVRRARAGRAERGGAAHRAIVEDGVATFDARDLTTRLINLELRRLLYEEGITEVVVQNPQGRHSLGVGILPAARSRSRAPRLLRLRTDRRSGDPHQGPRRLVVLREHDDRGGRRRPQRGSLTGAAMRGGDLVVKGRVGAGRGSTRRAARSSSAATPAR